MKLNSINTELSKIIGLRSLLIWLLISIHIVAEAQELVSESVLAENNLQASSSWSSTENENAVVVLNFINGTANGDSDKVIETFGHYPYKQHNRGIEDGIPGAVKALKTFKKNYPEFQVKVKKIHVDGNIVMTHSHTTLKKKDRGNDEKGFNVMDMWKVEDGKIIEHWDAMQPLNGSMRFFNWIGGGKIKNDNGVF